jgi:glycosyltransferase involved in cell wall biosynthesis
MKSVVLRGPILTQSGYGVHGRQVVKWLLRRPDIDVRFIATPWGDTPWIINPDACDGLAGKIMQRTAGPNAAVGTDVSLQLQLPNEWDPKLSRVNVGITAAVETDRCHPDWIAACNAMHSVIVPSQHVKQCLSNSGNVTRPIIVIPESYSEACAAPELPTLDDFPTPFNFLVFGQLTGNNPNSDRKNTFFTIKWLCEAFKNDKDVGIIVKTNAGRNSKIDRNLVINLMKQLLSEVRRGPNPRFYLLHGDMSDQEVAALYRHKQVKALVALTRGEGYGLPILEAAASGLPVIATGWSGHLDFLKHGKFISVYYQLGELHPSRVDNKIFMKGARWANPSEEDFKKRVLKFRDSSSVPKEWALDLQKKVVDLYSHERVCQLYDAALKEVI